ncbi:MAG TPA: hypothetical protein VFD43_07450 [Planctomycetota bacterium]|nr:hypothetical protein [Planctomycetota bacterium]
MDGNTIISRDGPSTDPFSVIEVEVTAPSPFELTVRVQPELAPDLANEMLETVGNAKGERSFAIKELDGPRLGASLKLNRTAFTIAGRPIDVAGGHLRVCDVEFGPLATGAVVTLKPGEVRVDDVFRGPLPAPVEAR